MIRKAMNKAKVLISARNRKYARAIAKESLAEGKKLGKLALRELKKEMPKAKKVLASEAKTFSQRLKKIRR